LHRNVIIESDGITYISNGSVGMPFYIQPSGLRIITLHSGKVTHHYYSLDQALNIPLTKE
jgi:hypothetical protein